VIGRRMLLGAGLLAGRGAARAQSDAPKPQPWPAGRPVPALELPGLEAPPWRLAHERGQVVVLNFWASWCEPCRAEMPALELLAERHLAERLTVIAVNYRETDAAIRRYLAQWPITLTIVRDADGAAARAFSVRIFPSTVLIGRDGRAVFTVVGEVDWTGAEARRWLAPLLKA
jgi:thiol-disulfide isomerase/thioredoxin